MVVITDSSYILLAWILQCDRGARSVHGRGRWRGPGGPRGGGEAADRAAAAPDAGGDTRPGHLEQLRRPQRRQWHHG